MPDDLLRSAAEQPFSHEVGYRTADLVPATVALTIVHDPPDRQFTRTRHGFFRLASSAMAPSPAPNPADGQPHPRSQGDRADLSFRAENYRRSIAAMRDGPCRRYLADQLAVVEARLAQPNARQPVD